MSIDASDALRLGSDVNSSSSMSGVPLMAQRLWLMSTSLALMSALNALDAFEAFEALISTSLLSMSACDAFRALMPRHLMPTALLRCLLATMQDATAPIAFGLLLPDVAVVLGMLLEICPG